MGLFNKTNKIRYKIKEIQEAGYKVVYQNQTTGTISYLKNGMRCQVSVYRGYNSHAKN